MVAILMMSAKLATLGLLKIKVFWNKGYGVIIFVHDVTNKILSRDSNHIEVVVMWPKCGNSMISMWGVTITSILMVLTRKTNFFDGSSCFKFNKLGLALGMTFKFYTSVGKRLKLKVRKLWGLILTFVEVPGEKLVGGAFLPPILNRVNCRNHRLSLCWPYLIKNIEYA